MPLRPPSLPRSSCCIPLAISRSAAACASPRATCATARGRRLGLRAASHSSLAFLPHRLMRVLYLPTILYELADGVPAAGPTRAATGARRSSFGSRRAFSARRAVDFLLTFRSDGRVEQGLELLDAARASCVARGDAVPAALGDRRDPRGHGPAQPGHDRPRAPRGWRHSMAGVRRSLGSALCSAAMASDAAHRLVPARPADARRARRVSDGTLLTAPSHALLPLAVWTLFSILR